MYQSKASMMIDLHGLSVKETKQMLLKQFKLIEEGNIAEFYIITGRGNHINQNGTRGVLKKILPKLLKPYAEHISETDPELGAYRVRLKRKSERPDIKALFDNLFGREIHEDYLQSLASRAEKDDMHALVGFACVHINSDDAEIKQKALDCLERAKTLASLEAYLLLGDFYYQQSKYKKAFSHFKYAAQHGDLEGMHLLARCYLLGQGVVRDDKQGVFWMTQAADGGHAFAQSNLGRSYYRGDYSESSIVLAVKYLKMAVRQSVPEAMVFLGRCYAGGDGVEQSFQEAFKLYSHAAEFDNVYALYQVGQYILDGRRGDSPSRTEAYPWFLKAAKLNDSDAQAQVGLTLVLGEKKNIPEGLVWLEKSIARKNKLALHVMAMVCLDEDIVKGGEAKAYQYIRESAEQGYGYAQVELAIVLLTGSIGAEKNIDEGIRWLTQAVEQHNFHMGFVLEYVRKNRENIDNEKLFAELCYVRAMFYLFNYVNKAEGMQWLQQAIARGSQLAEKFLSEKSSVKQSKERMSLQSKSNLFQPQTADDCLSQAAAFYKNGKYKEAIKVYYQLLSDRQDQNKAKILCNLGHCYYRLAAYQVAIKHYSESLEKGPDSLAAYQWRAKAYRKQASMQANDDAKADLITFAEQDERTLAANANKLGLEV